MWARFQIKILTLNLMRYNMDVTSRVFVKKLVSTDYAIIQEDILHFTIQNNPGPRLCLSLFYTFKYLPTSW